MGNKRILKAYERYDYNGKVVPGSLVLRDRIPKNGKWKELTGYQCCNDIIPVSLLGFKMFVTTVDSSSLFEFTLTASESGSINFILDWGDGSSFQPVTIASGASQVLNHEYADANEYTVTLGFTNTSYENISGLEASQFVLKGIDNVSYISSVVNLNLTNSGITTLNLGTMPNLFEIYLTDCSSLTGSLFTGSTLPALSLVYANNTSISNVDITATPDLYVLYSSGTAITNSTNIDNIFINILANDRTGGVIVLTGGTNAAPTAASAAARATLASLTYDYYLAYN